MNLIHSLVADSTVFYEVKSCQLARLFCRYVTGLMLYFQLFYRGRPSTWALASGQYTGCICLAIRHKVAATHGQQVTQPKLLFALLPHAIILCSDQICFARTRRFSNFIFAVDVRCFDGNKLSFSINISCSRSSCSRNFLAFQIFANCNVYKYSPLFVYRVSAKVFISVMI